MNSLMALLAFVVAVEYLVIALDVVPRLARIARVRREVVLAARWGATSFFLGCAITHAVIGLQTLLPQLRGAMNMPTGGGTAVAMAMTMVLPHVAQVLGGAVFIGISRSRLEVNITSKEDAAAAREQDQQLRSALDDAPVGIAFTAAANQPRYTNRAYRDMVGLGASGAGRHDVDLLEAMDPADFSSSVDNGVNQRDSRPVDVEVRVVRPDGAVHWLRARRSEIISSTDARVTTIVEDVTDRKTAQSVHAASERRFTRLADSISVGINLRQLHPPQFLWANAAYAEIVGADLQQDSSTKSDPALMLVHPEDEEAVLTRYWPMAQSGLVTQYEFRVLRPDGRLRWVHVTSSPVRDDDGEVVQVAGTVEDITARKAVEQAVLDERRRLRQAESVGRTGSWELDLESGSVTWSAGMSELYGLQHDPEARRTTADEQIDPDDRGELGTAITACADHGTPFQVRYQMRRADDGTVRWISVRGEAGYHEDRRVSIRSSVADVTHLVAAEAAAVAVAARSFQQAVFTASPDVISVWDFTSASITWSNRSIGAELGYDPGEVTTTEAGGARLLIHPDDRSRVAEAMIAARRSLDDQVVNVDYRMMHKDGSVRWFSRRTAPLNRDSNGQVSQMVEVIRDVSDVMATELELRHSALHDSLTGLPNRALLFDRIESAIARAEREGTEVGILFCDLDGFKRINDTGGHDAGDAVLVEVGERLRHAVRRCDSLARVGGDEFVVVLETGHAPGGAVRPVRDEAQQDPDGADLPATPGAPRTVLEIAELVAGRIRAALEVPVIHNGQAYSVSVSIGVAFAHGGSAADDVLRDADSAMYLAKQRGRDRFEIFDDLARAAAAERVAVERALRNALGPADQRHAALTVAYQPVWDLAHGHLVGFEALARLTGADGTAIPPDVFIPVAENTGLIAGLGATVLDLGLAGLARWRAGHVDQVPVTMAVNLSVRQVHQSDLGELVLGALSAHGLAPADLTLELTESILLDTGSAGLSQLSSLRDAGVGIAIDDFGTGYASLQYLTTLPISSLKVDKSFTGGLPTDATSATIVRAIAALAAELGLTCVIEGIETADQLDALPAGVLGQGYLLGRPTADVATVAQHSPALLMAATGVPGPRSGDDTAAFMPSVSPA